MYDLGNIYDGSLFAKRFIFGNKAKGQISKRVFQENKVHQIFRKTNISYSLIRKQVRGSQVFLHFY